MTSQETWSQWLESVSIRVLETDFRGQRLAELMYQYIIVIFSVVGFVAGYMQQSFRATFQIWCVGFLLAGVLSMGGWPWLRRHPVKWLESIDDPIPEDRAGAAPVHAAPTGRAANEHKQSGTKKR